MTVPDERTRALYKAKYFLRSLLDPSLTPRVPKDVRRKAYWVLRHFPSFHEIQVVAKNSPDILSPFEDYHEYEDQMSVSPRTNRKSNKKKN